MIKVYGSRTTRTFRAPWALEEIGVDYEHVPLIHGDRRSSKYLEINPNGRVPALVDRELTLFESMAITLYLVRTYDGGLNPKGLEDQSRAVQWMTELEPNLGRIDQGEGGVEPTALAVLDGVLEGRRFLLGGGFTIVDLNVAAVLSNDGWPVYVPYFAHLQNVSRWFEECISRPAVGRARGEGAGAG
jgi:glutathione S-transferase